MTIALACFLIGLPLGKYAVSAAACALFAGIVPLLLAALVFLTGFDIGCNRAVGRQIAHCGAGILLLAPATALGTVACAVAAGLALGIAPNEAAAVSAGFAYYSVSAGILTDLGGAELGALALVANIVREVLAFALIPLVATRLHPIAAIAPGGATSMDTTLPAIRRCAGDDVVVMAVLHGAVLTLLVPVLVPLLYRLL